MRLQQAVFEKRIVASFVLYREHGIEPILIKGWAAAAYYPEKWQRIYTDIDLAIEPDSFSRAVEIWRSDKGNRLDLDIHRGLRHLDTLSWERLFADSQLISLEGGEIRVLRPEDHLRILAVHWLNDGGGYREKLWDIYYLVQNRPADFDWERCLNLVEKNRRRWIVCAIGLAHRFLGLRIDDTPVAREARELPDWLVRAVRREWASETRLAELNLRDPRSFFKQLKKRLPPNPIQATIEMDGDVDRGSRLYYQMSNFCRRTKNFFNKQLLLSRGFSKPKESDGQTGNR